MQGKLIIAKLNSEHEGYSLSIDYGGEMKPLIRINGNSLNYQGPVALISIDPFVVFGLGEPTVVARILSKGPQVMYSTKELAHRLFEHGLKASWWKVYVQKNAMFTSLETFYDVRTDSMDDKIKIISGKDKKAAVLVSNEEKSYLISNKHFEADNNIKVDKHIALEDIRDYLYLDT